MATFPPVPNTKTILLSVGPNGGKTALLRHWQGECTVPSHYLALTPEDADPTFFIHRFLAEWPDIRDRYEAVRTDFDALPVGTALGRAIAETHPLFTFLLDDFHLSEGTPLESELMALLRHFPEQGTMAIASRHQLPPSPRKPASILDADAPFWKEDPKVADLATLPPRLIAKAFALHVVGESVYSPEGWELVRLNIAHAISGGHQLRPCWREVVSMADSLHPIAGVWEAIESELRGFRQRHIENQERAADPADTRSHPLRTPQGSPLPPATGRGDAPVRKGKKLFPAGPRVDAGCRPSAQSQDPAAGSRKQPS